MNFKFTINMCCVCLKEGDGIPIHNYMNISHMFKSVTQLKVTKNDGMPSLLCSCCIAELKIAYEFQKKALASHNHIKTLMDQISNCVTNFQSSKNSLIMNENEMQLTENAESMGTEEHSVTTQANLQEVNDEISLHQEEHQINNTLEFVDVGCTSNIETVNDEISLHQEENQDNNALESVDVGRIPNIEISPHQDGKSKNKKRFHCMKCDKKFALKTNLKRHELTHDNIKPFHCNICNKRFSQKTSLNQHMLLHSGERPHKCDFCEKRFTDKNTLINHERTHTGEKPFVCKICGSTHRQRQGLKHHEKRKHSGASKTISHNNNKVKTSVRRKKEPSGSNKYSKRDKF